MKEAREVLNKLSSDESGVSNNETQNVNCTQEKGSKSITRKRKIKPNKKDDYIYGKNATGETVKGKLKVNIWQKTVLFMYKTVYVKTLRIKQNKLKIKNKNNLRKIKKTFLKSVK